MTPRATSPITRRRALAALGGGAVLAACSDAADGTGASSTTTSTPADTGDGATPTTAAAATTGLAGRFDRASTCRLTPETTEGPYYIDVDSIRRDIREDREGQMLRVGIRVLDSACRPIPDAVVEIWHCDATGLYSGFEAASTGGGGPGRPGGVSSAPDDTRYLRGGQITDPDGIAEFVTVYPGWYRGRTVHIHTKVHVGNREVLTSQVFFDEGATQAVYEQEPYASDAGLLTFNRDDRIFDERLVLTLTRENGAYLGLITFVVD